jgi:photosystem II stability/assembly factor-like uncharacterized protein
MRRPILLLAALALAPGAFAQSIDPALWAGLEYREVGPYRGGRSAAVTGVPGRPMLYYMGATGGGVWRTEDGGGSWESVSDGTFGGSIGAVAVSEWDPNVIYVGGGEKTVRGNVSHGDGVWRSVDAGKTWTHVGLDDTHQIPRIRIHPRNPDLVYVAALGHLYGPNDERGVFRSRDGGATWEKILSVGDGAGAVDLVLDPTNPRILYAATWKVFRTPWLLSSGGGGSALWKSTDGGDSWTELTGRDNGLPEGALGIIGVAVSPVRPERVWAIVEAEDGGVFRSEDGGETWRRINDDRNLRQRAWYYTRIYAGTGDVDDVWVLNVALWHSTDGGATYERVRTPHGDHHDLWIAPEDADRLVVGDDGGAQVSLDGGASWSTMFNQPTAQFYRVTTDNHFPYRIYGGQQDNSTVRILHTSDGRSEREWEPTAGGESAWIAVDPTNPDLVYGGSYGGYLERVDHATGQSRNVNAWPDNPMGHGAEDYRFRFQWNFPIRISRHDPSVVLTGANVLFRSEDGGQAWTAISPDLTRADPSTLGPSGGPITKDNTSVEYYATIFTFVEGEEPGVIWTGSDDGLIHLTRDGGATWTDVTPPARIFPEWMQVNDMVPDPHNPAGLYVAGTRYRSDDFSPYLYRTGDYGASWKRIDQGIDRMHFTRTIEPDPGRAGLLYAGTERGMVISFDDGATWSPFQLNLPQVPVTDLEWKDHDLVVATQGRGFWILEDLTLLHHLQPADAERDFAFHGPHPATLGAETAVRLRCWFAAAPDSATVVRLRILEDDRSVIRTFSSDGPDGERIEPKQGVNTFEWNMRYPDAESFDGLVMWSGSVRGPRAAPGAYRARLVVGDDSTEVPFEIRPDPRSGSTEADLREQFEFLVGIRDKLSEIHRAIKEIRAIREQTAGVLERVPDDHPDRDTLRAAADAMNGALRSVEEALYQVKNRSGQDPLNFPIRLNDKLAGLASTAATGHYRPTDQAVAVRDELVARIDTELDRMRAVLEADLPAFNALVRAADIPAVSR